MEHNVKQVTLFKFVFFHCCWLISPLVPLKIDIDDCASHPCKNNGTCTDRVNGFNCSCAPGFNGTQCETGNCNRQCDNPNIITTIFRGDWEQIQSDVFPSDWQSLERTNDKHLVFDCYGLEKKQKQKRMNYFCLVVWGTFICFPLSENVSISSFHYISL